MKTKPLISLAVSLLACASAFGQVPITRGQTTFNTARIFPSGAETPSIDLYGQGLGASSSFASYGVAQFVLTKAHFGLGAGDTIQDITSLDVTLTYNDRSFTSGTLFELLATTDDLGDLSGISYNGVVDDIAGIDPAEFTDVPFSLGTFTYADTDGSLGGTPETFVATIDPADEAALIAALNAGTQFNVIVVATNTNDAITFSGRDNGFDPGDPMIEISIDANADTGTPLLSTSPANGEIDVRTDGSIILEFGEDVSAGTGNIEIIASDDFVIDTIAVDSLNVVFEGNTVTITPTTFLPGLTEMSVEFGAGVIVDGSGNSALSDETTLSFITAIDNLSPVFTQTGPFLVSDQSLAGTVVGDVDTNDDGVVDGESVYSIISAEDASHMMVGINGYEATAIFTVGETLEGTSGALNPTTAGDYTPAGILDGIGAYQLDASTVRALVNHELLHFRGNSYEVSNGNGGTYTIPSGARVSYFDIDIASRQVVDSGIAINQVYNADGVLATSVEEFQIEFLDGFSRFCSSALFEAEQFGDGRGLADRIYFTGEEDGGGFNAVGGSAWALDVATGDFWALPAFGRGAWENMAEIDTGLTTHVAMLLADDTSPYNVDEDTENEASPLFLYVGEKNPNGNFIERNGLSGGTLYVWVANSGNTLPSEFSGAGSSEAGTWVAVDNSANVAEASGDGSTGFDRFGYPVQRNLWTQAEAAGAFGFSRPEDVSINPVNGAEFVLASTGVDTYDIDEVTGNGADTFGTIYTGIITFDGSAVPTGATLTVLYDGDEDLTRALRSPDNLDWADDGLIYVQEDEAEEDTASGDEVLFGEGAANPNEAGIVQLNPASGEIIRIANIDRSIILDPSISNPLDAVDVDAGFAGEWESSGILDVSNLFGEMPGTLFLFDVQAHGIEDQQDVNPSSRINDSDLVEGGQLLFLERSFESMLTGLANNKAEAVFTVGETLPTTNALSVLTEDSYTPPGILDGLGAYALDDNTVRVFANHELLQFRGYGYEVSNGQDGTYTINSGARVSYFDIDIATRKVLESGLAIKTIYDSTGTIATDTSFFANNFSGFSRFCSSVLIEPEQFGGGIGLADRIYFTGEEDGSGFNTVGGAVWALDVATGDFWTVPAMGRGAWENIIEISTGLEDYVAFILCDDSSPFNVDDDEGLEASPLYLYVGEKNSGGNFLEQNGLSGGKLYVWVADSGNTLPSEFNGAGASETGTWVELDNTPDMGQGSEDGSTGFDEFGYPVQRNLWTQAEAAGAFGFSRPEDVDVNPFMDNEFVFASTGVDTYDDGSDTFGTIYTGVVTFDGSGVPTSGTITILYDGDEDPTRALRSPDNLDWADNGVIYVQEDEAEEDTFDGEPLFGAGAVNPNEAGIVCLDPTFGDVWRIANIDRSVIFDGSISMPSDAVDVDAGLAGEWESSGIIDVSTLFGEEVGTLFLLDVQAHGIEDQDGFNAASRINDSDLVEGGQLIFLELGTAEPTLNFADAFEINPNTGAITLVNPSEIDSSRVKYVRLVVEADDGVTDSVSASVDILINSDEVFDPEYIRVATFNASLNRNSLGELITDLSTPDNTQAQQIAEIIQRTNPDVLLINEFDYDANDAALELFKQNYLEISQNGQTPVYYGYSYNDESNTGIQTGFDLNNNGNVGDVNDAHGFGNFEGQFGMIVLSKFPIVEEDIRTFQNFIWEDMPGALLPADPEDTDINGDFDNYYTAEELEVLRLSSKSHWALPIQVGELVFYALAAHPTPPVFDGVEDRNGLRNHDEIRFWADFVNGEDYIYDDAGVFGGLEPGTPFVILGDYNADPFDGDSANGAADQILQSVWVNTVTTPSSLGGPEDSIADGNDNLTHLGDPSFDTADFSEPPGNIRVDYALPSSNFTILNAEVYWPEVGQPGADLIDATDHRMVFVDLAVDLEPGTFVLAGNAVEGAMVDGAPAEEGDLALVIVKKDGSSFDDSALNGLDISGDLEVGAMIGDFLVVGYTQVGPDGSVNVDGIGIDLQPIESVFGQFAILVFGDLEFEEDGSTNTGSGTSTSRTLYTDPSFEVEEGVQEFGDELDTIRPTQFTLQVLHASDLEGGIDAIERAPNFAAIIEALEDDNPAGSDGTVVISAGDNYIPGPFFAASSDFSLADDLQFAYEQLFGISLTDPEEGSEIETRNGAIDITIMNIIGFDASAIGNHEFDFGVETFRDLLEEEYDTDRVDPSDNIVPAEIEWHGTQFPYLSANIDFSGEEDLLGIFTTDILPGSAFTNSTTEATIPKFPTSQGDSTKIAQAVVLDVNGQSVGVVGGTTQRLTQITSAGGLVIEGTDDNNIPLLATQLQPIIDDVIDGDDDTLGTGDDVSIIILATHLQQLALEQELATLLNGVDVIIAGGSDTLLADGDDTLRPGDVAEGDYPFVATGLDGNRTLIVSTDGEYSYVGQLNVPFDMDGAVNVLDLNAAINGPISTELVEVEALWGEDDPFAADTRGGLVQGLVNEVISIVQEQDSNIFGYSVFFLNGDRGSIRTEETNLGNLTADANLWFAQQIDSDVVFSFKNGGGIRNPIGEIDPDTGELLPTQGNPDPEVDKPIGAISELDIADVLRFDNDLVTFTLSGADILEVLEHGFGASVEGSTQGRFPQLGGMQVAFTPPVDTNEDGDIDVPVVIRSFGIMGLDGRVTEMLYQDGEFVGEAETTEYKIVTLDFLASFGNFGSPGATAGDGYPFPGLGLDLVELGVGEQTALQDFLLEFFPTPELAFSEIDRVAAQDARVQNLTARFDSVGNDVPVAPAGALRLTPVASFASGVFDESAAEIVAFDAGTERLFVVSAATGEIRVLDASDAANGNLPEIATIDAPFSGFEPNSVDTYSGPLGDAVAVAWSDENGPAGRGSVVLYDPSTLAVIGSPITAGYLPDMLTFTPDGSKIVVANEGEAADDINPPGSVSVITFGASYADATHNEITFDRWNRREDVLRSRGVLVTQIDEGEASEVSEDLEPEYVAIAPSGDIAWVGLQEANAVAIVDLVRLAIRNIVPLGTVNHSIIPLDASDRDEGDDDEPINVTVEPGLFGLPQPDAIAIVEFEGMNYLLTANEGDARDFEELRFKDIGDPEETTYVFDPAVAGIFEPLQEDDELGRLEINLVASDLGRDGDVDTIMVFGGRSMGVYEAPVVGRFRQVSGTSTNGNNDIDEYTASLFSTVFHSNNDDNDSLESRSDAKGAEPEALTIGEIDGVKYAFLGLERQSAIMVYDVTDPRSPLFHAYVDNRNYLVDADSAEAGDLGPEGIEFIPADVSPLGVPTIAVANEVSGTVTLYRIDMGL